MRASHSLDRVGVTFDDDHTVADAGLFLTGPDTSGPAAGDDLIHSSVPGGYCIDDADILRCGSTAAEFQHREKAPPHW